MAASAGSRIWAILLVVGLWPILARSRGSLEQTVPDSVRGGAGREVELGQDAVDVAVNSMPAQNESGGDLLVTQALRHQSEDFHLPRSQAGWMGSLTSSLASLDLYFTQQRGCGLGIQDRS